MDIQDNTKGQLTNELKELQQEILEGFPTLKKNNTDFRLKIASLVCALTALLIGLLVLAGWVFGLYDLSSLGKNFVPMADETALLFFIAGSALALMRRNAKSRILQYFQIGSAVFIGIIALLTLVDFATAYRWNLSDILSSTNSVKAGIVTGKMSLITALCFIFVSIAFLLLPTKVKKYSAIFSFLIFLTGYTIVVGYSYGVPFLYGGTAIPMAWSTAIAFIILSAGLIFAAGKETPPISYFMGDSTRALLLRNTLPIIFLLIVAHDFIDAFSNANYSSASALSNSIMDIVVLLIVGIVISLKSSFIGNLVDRNTVERKQAEEALQQSEKRLQDIIFSMGDWVWEVDENGVYTYSSQKGFDYFGPVRNNVIGKTPFDFMPPDEAQKIAGIFLEIVKNKAPIKDLENWNISASGELICLLTNGVPILDEQGNLKGYRGVDKDITERKRLEEALMKESTLMKTAVENLPIIFYLIDRDGLFQLSIGAGLKGLGLKPNQVVGLSVYEIYKDFPAILDSVKRSLAGEPAHFESTVTGSSHYNYLTPISDTKGISFGIAGVAIDITEHLSIEKALLKNERELKRAQEITHIGSFSIDLTTNEVTWTEELYKMYGFDPTLPPPILDENQKLFTPESWALLSSSIANTVLTGDSYDIELKTVRNGGVNGWMWARGEAIANEKGKIIEIMGAVQDISEHKMKEQELAAAKSRAEESDRLKSAFLANMSHEIRTPMNGILGFADLLKEPDLSGEQQQEYIRIIGKSGARMLNIINDIVDISKIEAGLMKLEMKESNVNEQIEYIYTFFKPEMEAKGLKFSVKNTLPAKEAILKTDREKLYAILTNLVKNAIIYTEKGSIEFGYSKKGDLLEFFVKDTGIGVPKDRQEAIFERFIQADIEDVKARQGAGLGLAITKSYIEMLGGKIWIESEEGIGSTFYFTLPYDAETTENSAVQNAVESVASGSLVKTLKILIAEDDEVSEMLIDISVKKFGKEIMKVRTGVEAVDACREHPDIDLILMDIQMPEMGGYEATRQIRKFNREVVIIAQTAFGLSGDREKAIEAGCNDYISKPIKSEDLNALIMKYFNK
jgi:PAS domain S-box-containing protein